MAYKGNLAKKKIKQKKLVNLDYYLYLSQIIVLFVVSKIATI